MWHCERHSNRGLLRPGKWNHTLHWSLRQCTLNSGLRVLITNGQAGCGVKLLVRDTSRLSLPVGLLPPTGPGPGSGPTASGTHQLPPLFWVARATHSWCNEGINREDRWADSAEGQNGPPLMKRPKRSNLGRSASGCLFSEISKSPTSLTRRHRPLWWPLQFSVVSQTPLSKEEFNTGHTCISLPSTQHWTQ